jgi:hypothetical protein
MLKSKGTRDFAWGSVHSHSQRFHPVPRSVHDGLLKRVLSFGKLEQFCSLLTLQNVEFVGVNMSFGQLLALRVMPSSSELTSTSGLSVHDDAPMPVLMGPG